MREELCSSPQPAWSRSYLRSRTCLQTAPCSSSHLDFLKHLGKESAKQSGDTWLGIALLGTSILVLFFSRSIISIGLGDNFDPGPTAFPLGLSALLAIGGVTEIWQSRGNRTPAAKTNADSKLRTVLQLLACFLIYVVILPWLGFSVSTLIMATGMMMLLGNSWKHSLIVSIFLITLIYLLFVVLFKVPLPGGVFGLPF
jgi:putative tricarboxylic transport membrane protein